MSLIILIAVYVALIAIWIGLYRYMRRRFKEEIKEVENKRKDKTVTFLTIDDVPGRYVDIEYSEKPWCEMHRKGN